MIMDRREVLRRVAILTGATVIGGEMFLLTGCKTDSASGATAAAISSLAFNKDQVSLLQEIGSIILPAPQGSIGAKDVRIGEFMAKMVSDCYQPDNQKIFMEGLSKISSSFAKATPEQKANILIEFDNEARAYNKSKKKEDPTHFFTMMRQLTVLGFATSKEGATQVFNWVPVPGKFDANFKYKKGDKPFI
jgi:hypothetical protein